VVEKIFLELIYSIWRIIEINNSGCF